MKLERVTSKGAHSVPALHIRAPRVWGRPGFPRGTGCGGALVIGRDSGPEEPLGRLESCRDGTLRA